MGGVQRKDRLARAVCEGRIGSSGVESRLRTVTVWSKKVRDVSHRRMVSPDRWTERECRRGKEKDQERKRIEWKSVDGCDTVSRMFQERG